MEIKTSYGYVVPSTRIIENETLIKSLSYIPQSYKNKIINTLNTTNISYLRTQSMRIDASWTDGDKRLYCFRKGTRYILALDGELRLKLGFRRILNRIWENGN